MNSDSNPYDQNPPVPNPYESTSYGSTPPTPNPNYPSAPNPPAPNPNYPPYPPAPNPSYPPVSNPNYPPYPYAPGNQPPSGNQYGPGQGPPNVQYPNMPNPQYSNTPPPGAPPYQYPNAGPPLPAYPGGNQLLKRRSSTGLRLGVIALVVLVIIIGAIGIAIPVHNAQVANDNATVTAQAHARVTATAQANATVQASATAQVNATATAVASTYPFSADLKLNDPLSDNTRGYGWLEGANCSFTGGAYHNIDKSTNTFLPCPALKTNFSNFTYQASMQIVKGSIGGITFRGDYANSKFYAFVLGTDGSYAVFLYTSNGKPQTLKESNAGAVTQYNANQANLVGVVARGSKLDFYVNKQEVTTLTDTTYSSGQIGTIAYNVGQDGEVIYSNAQVWAL